MRAWIEDEILYLHADDTPAYRKQGSIVRNSFFWALRSIAANSAMGKAWEFEAAVWFALQRMLNNFTDAGYLRTRETQLEFREDAAIPKSLQSAATWISATEFEDELGSDPHLDLVRDRRAAREPEARPAPPYSSYVKKQQP